MDQLQVLDVSCFYPLKAHYEHELTARVHETGAREPLRKETLLQRSGQSMGLTEENIKSGFLSTGTYPVDLSKYKEDRLEKVKLLTYKRWKNSGCPTESEGKPDLSEEKLQTVVNGIGNKSQIDITVNEGNGSTQNDSIVSRSSKVAEQPGPIKTHSISGTSSPSSSTVFSGV